MIGWNICQSKLDDPPLWGSGTVKTEADVCELNFLCCVWVVFRLNTSQHILGKNRWRLNQHQQSAVLFLKLPGSPLWWRRRGSDPSWSQSQEWAADCLCAKTECFVFAYSSTQEIPTEQQIKMRRHSRTLAQQGQRSRGPVVSWTSHQLKTARSELIYHNVKSFSRNMKGKGVWPVRTARTEQQR